MSYSKFSFINENFSNNIIDEENIIDEDVNKNIKENINKIYDEKD